jgi:hypothetical protein
MLPYGETSCLRGVLAYVLLVCLRMHTHKRHMYIYIYTYTYTYIYIYMYVRVKAYMYMHTYIHVRIRIDPPHIGTKTQTNIHTYTYTCSYTYTYTYTHPTHTCENTCGLSFVHTLQSIADSRSPSRISSEIHRRATPNLVVRILPKRKPNTFRADRSAVCILAQNA